MKSPKRLTNALRVLSLKFEQQRVEKELPEAFGLLSVLLKSGVDIEEAIDYAKAACPTKTSRKYLLAMREGVEQGQRLSQVFEREVEGWLPLLLATAELSGQLPEVLLRWSEETRERRKWTTELARRSAYPTLLFVSAILTMVVIGSFVLPQFLHMYKDLGLQVPRLTIIIAGAWRAVPPVLVGVLLALLGGWTAIHLWGEQLRHRQYGIMRRLPFYRLLRLHRTQRLCFTLGLLTEAGLPVMDAASALGDMTPKTWLTDAGQNIARLLALGVPLVECFEGDWDPMLSLQIRRASVSGDLPGALLATALFSRDEFARRVETLLGFVEPLLSLAVGVVVATTMFSLYVPMYTLVSKLAG